MTRGRVAGWDRRIAEAQLITHETIGTVAYRRTPYGVDYPDGKVTCRDCGVEHGQLHVPTCCVERCPACGNQAFGCDCHEAAKTAVQ